MSRQVNEKIPGLCGPSHSRNFRPGVSDNARLTSSLRLSNEGIHYYRETLQRCREDLAQWLQIEDAQRIAFVPNATTASWLVLSRIPWKSGDQVLTTTHENSTVLKEIMALQPRGVHVHTLDPSSPDELEAQIEQLLKSRQVRAIVISHVSHIDGRIFPIERLYRLTQSYHALLIVDGAQAVGHIPVNFHGWQGFPHSNQTCNKRSRPLSNSLANFSIPMKVFTIIVRRYTAVEKTLPNGYK